MAADISLLESPFREKALELLETLKNERGFVYRPFYTLRTPLEQARLWRQSRASEEIKATIHNLRNLKADFLADCIERVGPQYGKWATNALPGYSWHQWGQAIDCFKVKNGEADWRVESYAAYHAQAKKLGLYPAFVDWMKDAVHVQSVPPHISVKAKYNTQKVNDIMKERFDNSSE